MQEHAFGNQDMTGHVHMRRGFLILTGLLILLLAGCRGGVLVFKGTHESQDEALLSRLGEQYPKMAFTCTGRTEGAVHTVEAADGTQFPAWTAAKGGGDFQVLDYYLEEWLRAKGYFERLEDYLEGQGLGFSYHDYNHYERHFQFEFGALDAGERRERAAAAAAWAKAEFDSLRRDFEDSTGRTDILLYFHGGFTWGGEEHSGTFNLSLREGDSWGHDYPFDDYGSYLEEYVEKIDREPDID